MGDRVSRKTIQKKRGVKNILFFVSVFFALLLIIVTIFFSVPTIFRYMSQKGYISPLSATSSRNGSLGSNMTEDMLRKSLHESNVSVTSITAFDEGFLVILDGKEKVIFSRKKPLADQISSLQLISSRLTIEGKHFASLDLRFDRPVLVPK